LLTSDCHSAVLFFRAQFPYLSSHGADTLSSGYL
jgi:hypothetical protein